MPSMRMHRSLQFIAFAALASCAVGVNTGAANDAGASESERQEEEQSQMDGGRSADAGAKPALDAAKADATAKADTSAPPVVDSATPCPGYALPSETAACKACQSSSPTCQPNGCFNGYYCNLSSDKCAAKPSGC